VFCNYSGATVVLQWCCSGVIQLWMGDKKNVVFVNSLQETLVVFDILYNILR
jgi:hypothetical protein